jgi:hypothetical protein
MYTNITREMYEREQQVTTNPSAGRHYPDAPDIHEYLERLWTNYVEESDHEGAPCSLKDFVEYMRFGGDTA